MFGKFTKNKTFFIVGFLVLVLSTIFVYTRTGYDEEKITDDTNLFFKKEYQDSDIVRYYDDESPPEMFRNFNFEGFKKGELKEFLPSPWKVEDFSQNQVSLIYKGEEYDEDEINKDDDEIDEIKYISVYKGRIAIYKGNPSNEELIEVTPYEAKEVYKEELERGIPFITNEERERILESYTS
ncbi:BofC C-terminal domain-containing protein [Natranaerofaba carboxydovora]|uniref:BofC C-terminal domain-containing protein n=1 Tax=Natranaerofaba carboxydovora TaxID=2742683 RepID=UPI001F146524|nr:BofC C-terminal domain-containing protein [Natranaerofaba carboxydovora]UMZ74025.1 hypothetical protein ACONDI_01596 [Natranaerofaba carboxydovora]